ncbi:MAG: bifunctional hydroxymethylpyrimidine kinase/phosphomethylpyrimidine kinase [Gemmatimonadota bacterium]
MATNLVPPPIALTIAGSDSGGGAGIQADLKTFHQFGVHGTSVLVAITAQNTVGVRSVHLVPAEIISAQIAALAEDLPPAALKTGMLATADLIRLVAREIRERKWSRYVQDPVMVATSGDRLLATAAESALREELLPLAALVTPNLDEAEVLTGLTVRDPEGMKAAGDRLLDMGARAALIKGGHLGGDEIVDLLVAPGMTRRFAYSRIRTSSTHGTGCTLSAAITAGLALERSLDRAVEDGLSYVRRAIETAPALGAGHGPVNHRTPALSPQSSVLR